MLNWWWSNINNSGINITQKKFAFVTTKTLQNDVCAISGLRPNDVPFTVEVSKDIAGKVNYETV